MMRVRGFLFVMAVLATPVLSSLLSADGGALLAQSASEARRVAGRVLLPAPDVEGDSSATVVVPDVWVTLHRVAPDLAGPLDSMRTGRDGSYRFQYRTTGTDDAIYFVSAVYGGIAYFTNPLRTADTRSPEADIAVFDTTTRAFPLTVRGRHLIVGSLDSTGSRTVVEVFELSNDSSLTIVATDAADAQPTWRVALPRVARDVKAGQGDLPADAFVQSEGEVALYAALPPGLKQLSVSYSVPGNAFPLPFSIADGAVVLEVLLEEPDASVVGANLVAAEPVALEGRQFQRFLAQDVRAGDSITVRAPGDADGGSRLYVTVLLGAIALLMLTTLLRAGARKQRPYGEAPLRAMAPAPELPTPERLAREIADLDAAFAAQANPSDAVRDAYEKRRAELADVLREELAAGGRQV
jgi:hypothetical protein